jgi:predicted NBD/HSP70 family sugar kinase
MVELMKKNLQPEQRERLQGVGLAAPLTIGGWQQLLGFPQEVSEAWSRTDLRFEVEQRTGMPVMQIKDTAAACIAELVEGQGRNIKSFLYLFVDTFIGGGLVIDSHLRAGVHGNAGAVGSLSLGLASQQEQTKPQQLLNVASLISLENRYRQAGLQSDAVGDSRAMQQPWLSVTQQWLNDSANAIALSVHSAACLLELDGCIVDGAFNRDLQQALVTAIQQAMQRYSWQGVSCPELLSGTIGSDARAIGGALLPLYENFAPDRDLFLKLD